MWESYVSGQFLSPVFWVILGLTLYSYSILNGQVSLSFGSLGVCALCTVLECVSLGIYF